MAVACANPNTLEFKALENKYKNRTFVQIIIDDFQNLNNTDIIPSVDQAEAMIKNQKKVIKFQSSKFTKILISNLENKGYIRNVNGKYNLLVQKHQIEEFLKINKFPLNVISYVGNSVEFESSKAPSFLKSKDVKPTKRTRSIINHLQRMFPSVNIQVMDSHKARKLYESLPDKQKIKDSKTNEPIPFERVNSFFVNSVAVLVNGRVTDEIAAEEILHPFVESLLVDNVDLFNNLLDEASKTFPELMSRIDEDYAGLPKTHINLEKVTQTLSRHFTKQYEKKPSQGFLKKVKDFIDWFFNIVSNLHEYITGKKLEQGDTTAALSSDSKLSDIAKMLNTPSVVFNMNPGIAQEIRYSLSPKLKSTYENIYKIANDPQKAAMQALLQRTIDFKDKEVQILAASPNIEGAPLVARDISNDDHRYFDWNSLVNGKRIEYASLSSRISGPQEIEETISTMVGTDFGSILEAVAAIMPIESVELKILSKEDAKDAYTEISEWYEKQRAAGIIMVPEVTVYDKSTKTAGTIDLLLIHPDGKLSIMDLKTSKNDIDELISHKGKRIKRYDKPYTITNEDSIIYQANKDELSTKQKHNLQVNAYRRMLENMGFEVSLSDTSAVTWHIKVDIEKIDGEDVYTGKFQIVSDPQIHSQFEEQLLLDLLIPLNVNQKRKDEINKAYEQYENGKVNTDTMLKADEMMPEAEVIDTLEYSVITDALVSYQKGLIEKDKAMEMVRSNVYMDRTRDEVKTGIRNSISMVSLALTSDGKLKSEIYTELLRDALKQIESFEDYIKNPENFGKGEYITYALNFERFLKTFEGLYLVGDSVELNNTQIRLIRRLSGKANEMMGTGIGNNKKEGLIDKAIYNYVREVVKDRSNFEFTGSELDDLLKMGTDIGGIEFQSRDLATSRDQLLSIMDKIYKSKKQELYDKLEKRDILIRNAASKLLKLSDEKDLQKLYDFMLVFNKNGEFEGRYVEEIGQEYYDMINELMDATRDKDGNPKVYADVTNLAEASDEDIKNNIELAEAKKKISNFFNAQTRSKTDQPIDGEYHYYIKEFKDARKKHEIFVPQGEHGWWQRKDGISDNAWNKYQLKYFEKIGNENFDPVYAERIKGKYTGKIIKDVVMYVPKKKYRRARTESRGGKVMTSKKYAEIMRPDDQLDALGKAKKEFYIFFTETYNDLLDSLPRNERDKMVGRVPLIRGKVTQELKGRGPLFTKLFAKTTRGIKNLFVETAQNRTIYADEAGNLIDQLPIFYTGVPRRTDDLEKIDQKIQDLKARQADPKTKIGIRKYEQKLALLEGERLKLESRPSAGELNKDLGNGLLKFAGMAEHFETMGEIKDTLDAFVKVIEKREYQPADKKVKLGKYFQGRFVPKGSKQAENVKRRAKKWMHMVYYDNDELTKGFMDKAANGLIKYSSLSYVAFNPFGNFNNYALGRVSNLIEAIGQRHYSAAAYRRSTYLWNQRFLPSIVQNLGYSTKKAASKDSYDVKKPTNKYEAMVEYYRMMDTKGDIRESGSEIDRVNSTWLKRRLDLGYVLQDAAEWNVQTKVGVAMVIDTMVKNSETGDQISLYDAYEFDKKTQTLTLDPKWSKVVKLSNKFKDKEGNAMKLKEEDMNNQYRYDLRNRIREVNKQIHGNYAYEDRMVMQSSTLGKLGAQFHKWVAPAIRARFGTEYFDENLNWMEGRYLSWWKYIWHVSKSAASLDIGIKKWETSFLEKYGDDDYGYTNLEEISSDDPRTLERIIQDNQRSENLIQNAYRSMGELMIVASMAALSGILSSLFAMDDDDDDITKRFKNIIRYQLDRTYKELILFWPGVGMEQQYQMVKSPIASTRTLGEIGEALKSTIYTPIAYLWQDDDEFWKDSSYVYQRGKRAGTLKLKKEWQDAIPILYAVKKWDNYLEMSNFFIK